METGNWKIENRRRKHVILSEAKNLCSDGVKKQLRGFFASLKMTMTRGMRLRIGAGN